MRGGDSMNGQKNDVHCFRMSPELWKYLQDISQSAGINPSKYVRRLIFSDKNKNSLKMVTKDEFILQKEKNRAINELSQEIRSIGVNINQIVKNVNSHFYMDYEKDKLFALMKDLQNLLKEYIKRIDNLE